MNACELMEAFTFIMVMHWHVFDMFLNCFGHRFSLAPLNGHWDQWATLLWTVFGSVIRFL